VAYEQFTCSNSLAVVINQLYFRKQSLYNRNLFQNSWAYPLHKRIDRFIINQTITLENYFLAATSKVTSISSVNCCAEIINTGRNARGTRLMRSLLTSKKGNGIGFILPIRV